MNSGRVMELKVLDYAEAHVPCRLGEITDAMSRSICIPVSMTWVQGVLEAGGYRITSEGSMLMVDRAPDEQAG